MKGAQRIGFWRMSQAVEMGDDTKPAIRTIRLQLNLNELRLVMQGSFWPLKD